MSRRAFTLMELLVVIAIISVLMSMLLPAIQRTRESANRSNCQNNLRQLSLAIHNYHANVGVLPPGFQEVIPIFLFYRGNTWYAYILPYVEQEALARKWNYADPINNVVDLSTMTPLAPGVAPTSVVVKTFVCPTSMPGAAGFSYPYSGTYLGRPYDKMTVFGNFAPCSYAGNAGSCSYFPGDPLCKYDGALNLITDSPTTKPIRLPDITDGTTNTLLLGERYLVDPNFDAMTTVNEYPIGKWCAWGWSGSWKGAGHVLASSRVPMNYKVPSPTPSLLEKDKRLSGFGSAHSGICNFSFCDGSIRPIRSDLSTTILTQLCVRNDGGTPSGY